MSSFKGPKIAINDVSGNLVKINTSGAMLVSTTVDVGAVTVGVSGQTLWLVSGENTVQLTSGYNIVTTSISGNYVTISGEPVTVSGNVVKMSGETFAIWAGSGRNPVYITNRSGNQEVVVTASGQLAVETTVSVSDVAVSGQTVAIWGGSGRNPVYITNRSGNQEVVVTASGQLAVESTVTVGDVAISGQTLATWPASGRNAMYLTARSGNQEVIITASGQVAVEASITTNISGNTVAIWGGSGFNAVYITNQSGNVAASLDDGGRLLVTNSGIPVVGKISGETIVSQISGQIVRLTSGFNPVQLVSGTNLVREAEPFNVFTATTLLITGASGGIALLSGECSKVTIRNIGDSGTVMFVGYSGTAYAPWVASGQSWPMFSGAGFWIRDGDAGTFPVPQARTSAVLRVVSHTSGARVSYMGAAF